MPFWRCTCFQADGRVCPEAESPDTGPQGLERAERSTQAAKYMIITRTPFRISFFGGGTDYPVWYREHGGAVLATTINKYCYLSCRWLPPFFDYRSRILYSNIENVQDNRNIQHPS